MYIFFRPLLYDGNVPLWGIDGWFCRFTKISTVRVYFASGEPGKLE